MKRVFLSIVLLLFSCGEVSYNDQPLISTDTYSYLAGQTITVKPENADNYDEMLVSLFDESGRLIEAYPRRPIAETYVINRSFYSASRITTSGRYFLRTYFFSDSEQESQTENEIFLEPSILVQSLCHEVDCELLSGNVLEQVPQTLRVKTVGNKTVKFVYTILSRENTNQIIHEFDSPTNFDTLSNIVFEKVREDYSAYIGGIQIDAYDIDGSMTTTSLPVKVVRPIEVRYNGNYVKAQVYAPVPVSGCIPGNIDTRVVYSESSTETRQNSVSVGVNSSISKSLSNATNSNLSEGISISSSQSRDFSSTTSESENFSESQSSSESSSNSDALNFSTNDGESWSWNVDTSESATNSSTTANNVNGSVNGSVTVGVSGEGSLPFLAKATGKVETTVGVSAGMGRTTTEGNASTSASSRGYSMSGNSTDGRSWGSTNSESNSKTITGAYALGRGSSTSASQGSSQSEGRIWNLSEGVSRAETVTSGDSESINETIVKSSSSTTTFSFNGYIPHKRFGMFYRQTTRWIKRSEIVVYDVNGFSQTKGYIDMNEWSWAPELAINEECEFIKPQNSEAACFIEPCF